MKVNVMIINGILGKKLLNNNIVVFDLDGTLALIEHRRHFVKRIL